MHYIYLLLTNLWGVLKVTPRGKFQCKDRLFLSNDFHDKDKIVLRPSYLNNALQWRHNGVSNNQHHDCLLNHLLRRRSKKTSKLHVTGLCEGNSQVTGEFPTQRASNAEMLSFDDVIMGDSYTGKMVTSYWNGSLLLYGAIWQESIKLR